MPFSQDYDPFEDLILDWSASGEATGILNWSPSGAIDGLRIERVQWTGKKGLYGVNACRDLIDRDNLIRVSVGAGTQVFAAGAGSGDVYHMDGARLVREA